MKNRYLLSSVQELALMRNKMAFVSGPRQCGKTTMAKRLIKDNRWHYYNWDDVEFRRLWTKSPKQSLVFNKKPGQSKKTPIVIFDEIHKAKAWKGRLKGIYDTMESPCQIVVTGSARLDVYKKGGDSLMGRYVNFRLHPFSFAELTSNRVLDPDHFLSALVSGAGTQPRQAGKNLMKDLLVLGGFPEPFFAQSKKIYEIWRRGRLEKIIREDLRDLSRLPELSQIEMLASLLPLRASQMLSIQALREDLEVAFDTVKRWMKYLEALYYYFEIKPWSKSVVRSLKKEGKLYLWDWAEVKEEGLRFENMLACHLLKACHYWTDTGEGSFDLYYLRNKQKNEIDFLITRDRQPWLPIECKLNEEQLVPAMGVFVPQLKVDHFVQVVRKSGVRRFVTLGNVQGQVMSADQFLSYLV